MRKEAVLKQPREPRRLGWKSTEAGARARAVRTAACKMPRAQEAGVEGHVPEAVEGPLLEEFPPSGEERAREASRGNQGERTGAHRCPRLRSGCRIPRVNGECCRDPRGKYLLLRKERPLTLRPRPAGADRIEADKVKSEQPDAGHHGNNSYLTREEYRGYYSRQDRWIRLRGWPS